jgi:hypothetical protein
VLKNVHIISILFNICKQYLKKLNNKLLFKFYWEYLKAWEWNKTITKTCLWNIITFQKFFFRWYDLKNIIFINQYNQKYFQLFHFETDINNIWRYSILIFWLLKVKKYQIFVFIWYETHNNIYNFRDKKYRLEYKNNLFFIERSIKYKYSLVYFLRCYWRR